MRNAFKVAGICIAVVLFLCITINNRTLFAHIYSVISPATTAVQNLTERVVSNSYEATSDYTKQLFDNSLPRKAKDTVRSKLAGIKKSAEPLEDIAIHEKRELDALIKTHR